VGVAERERLFDLGDDGAQRPSEGAIRFEAQILFELLERRCRLALAQQRVR
jgi:hypothetical protein